MPTVVATFILVIAVFLISIIVFFYYAGYLGLLSPSIINQEYLIGLSKSIQISVSNVAFKGVSPNLISFNVSYLITVSSPAKVLTVIPFVTVNSPSIFYSQPSTNQNVIITKANSTAYIPLKNFRINGPVYIPQQNMLLGNLVNIYAYNMSSNSSYVIYANVKPGQIIVLWFLLYYSGKWYRLGYGYLDPNPSLAVNTISGTGKYNVTSQSAPQPLISVNNQGFQFGMWFSPIINSSIPVPLLNISFNSVSHGGSNYTLTFYVKNSNLYLSGTQIPNTLIAQLNVRQYYFLNFSFGSFLNLVNNVNVNLYNSTTQINKTLISLNIGSHNGYNFSVTFGSTKYSEFAIFQAFFVTVQDKTGLPAFYNVSNQVLNNGYLYNNTNNLFNIINNNNNLYAVGYWYFVYPSFPIPKQISGLLWYYWKSNNLYNLTIPETSPNTYVAV
ncbi:hypothetical protein SUSAZ_07970 [Sulfolobus acidocaldarius SUSAZ]|nr:hypothetical protein SUSAZ_07970 [Sulfolobus acidocaldarius SUSAZ]